MRLLRPALKLALPFAGGFATACYMVGSKLRHHPDVYADFIAVLQDQYQAPDPAPVLDALPISDEARDRIRTALLERMQSTPGFGFAAFDDNGNDATGLFTVTLHTEPPPYGPMRHGGLS